MKRILTLVFLLFAVASFGQMTGVDKVATIIQLKTYNRTAAYVWVGDSSTIYSPCSPCEADEITRFEGTQGRVWGPLVKGVTDTLPLSIRLSQLQELLASKVDTGNMNSKADLVGGKVPTSQIPALAITQFLGDVGSEEEMLELTGQSGDWCLRTDDSTNYMLIDSVADVAENWRKIGVPNSPVLSINNQTGVVNLGKDDIGLGNVQNVDQTNASNLTSGTVADARLSGNVARRDGNSLINTDTLRVVNGSDAVRISVNSSGNTEISTTGSYGTRFIGGPIRANGFLSHASGHQFSNLALESAAGSFGTNIFRVYGTEGAQARVVSAGNVVDQILNNQSYSAWIIGRMRMFTWTSGEHPVLSQFAIRPGAIDLARGADVGVASTLFIEGPFEGLGTTAVEKGNWSIYVKEGRVGIGVQTQDSSTLQVVGGITADSLKLTNLPRSSTPLDSALYVNSSGEVVMGPLPSGSSFDTTGQLDDYQVAINARVKISDTADMLAAYRDALAKLPQTKQLASDDTNDNSSANTWEDVEGLSFPVKAGKSYEFKFTVWFTAAVTTTGSRWSVAGSSTPTSLHYYSQWDISSSGLVFYTGRTSFDDNTINVSASSTTASNRAIVEGRIVASADDTIVLRFASEISNSAITAKAKVSTVTWTQLD